MSGRELRSRRVPDFITVDTTHDADCINRAEIINSVQRRNHNFSDFYLVFCARSVNPPYRL